MYLAATPDEEEESHQIRFVSSELLRPPLSSQYGESDGQLDGGDEDVRPCINVGR